MSTDAREIARPPHKPGAARIVLIRHGHSSHIHDDRWLHPSSVRAFEDAYDAAGIRDDSIPPPALCAAAANAGLLCASDLRRAIDSAHRLAPEREIVVSPLLREIRLELPTWFPLRLPIATWDFLSHTRWSYRLLMMSDHEHMRRADAAARWLEEHVSQVSSVAAVTHAGFRRLLAATLIARGWQHGPLKRTYENWSGWELLRP